MGIYRNESETEMSGIDARRMPRIECSHVAKMDVDLGGASSRGQVVLPVAIRSASAYGLGLTVLEDACRLPPEGMLVSVYLEGGEDPLRVPGRVVWTRNPNGNDFAVELGLQLLLITVTARERRRYAAWMSEMVRDSRRRMD